jgi:hypothetical protein
MVVGVELDASELSVVGDVASATRDFGEPLEVDTDTQKPLPPPQS